MGIRDGAAMIAGWMVVLAVLCVVMGFHHSRMRRLRAECKQYGHEWQEHGRNGSTYFDCMRCGVRV